MGKASLRYPFEAPTIGSFIEVAPGVLWLRLPLPYRLNSINVWALEDEDGWALVDTGTCTEETVAIWERLTSQPPFDRPLKRVLVTHMHPDHIGMSGWLTRKHSVKLWIPRLEYLTCRTLVSDTGREAPSDGLRFYAEAGWSDKALDIYRARFGSFGKHVYSLPDSYKRIEDGQLVRIGRYQWEVVAGSGHSPEHACLYCSDLKVLISGDQVLPRISPNVSVYPTEPDANPMDGYLKALDTLRGRVPADVLVLPSHNDCFYGLHDRIAKLQSNQSSALRRLFNLLEQPQRVVDVFVALFNRTISEDDPMELQLATGEAIACLNYLIARGEVSRDLRSGISWYSWRQLIR